MYKNLPGPLPPSLEPKSVTRHWLRSPRLAQHFKHCSNILSHAILQRIQSIKNNGASYWLFLYCQQIRWSRTLNDGEGWLHPVTAYNAVIASQRLYGSQACTNLKDSWPPATRLLLCFFGILSRKMSHTLRFLGKCLFLLGTRCGSIMFVARLGSLRRRSVTQKYLELSLVPLGNAIVCSLRRRFGGTHCFSDADILVPWP